MVRLVGCAVPSRAEHSVVFRPPALGECERADLFGDGSQVSLALQWRTRRIASAERGFFWPFHAVCSHSPNHNVGLTRRNELWEFIVILAVYVRPSLSSARRLPLLIPMSGPQCARKSSSMPIARSPGFATPGLSMSSTPLWRCRASTPMATASSRPRSLSGSEYQVAQGLRLLHLRSYR